MDIVKAFAQPVIPRNSRLLMVGDGPDFEETKRCARELAVANRVEFVGSQTDVRPYLWQADVFVLASDDEGAPLALLEAMACGLPYVSTAWGAAAMLPPGECGLVVPPRAPEVLAAAMADMINDPERRHAMGARAQQRAEKDFGEESYLEAHLQLIQHLEQRDFLG